MSSDRAYRSRAHFSGLAYYVPAVLLWLLALVLVLAGLAFEEFRAAESGFTQFGDTLYRQIDTRLKANEVVIDGVTAFLRAAPDAEGKWLRHYAEEVLSRYPFIYQLRVEQYVSRKELPKFLARMRQTVSPSFNLRTFSYTGDRKWEPVPDKKAYYPVVLVAPVSASKADVLGLDVDSVRLLRDALHRAITSGMTVASPPYRLPGGEIVYDLFRPVGGSPPEERGDRVVALIVRAAALVSMDFTPPDGTVVTLSSGAPTDNRRLFRIANLSGLARSVGQAWMPRLRYSRRFDDVSEPFQLDIERRMGWETFITPTVWGVIGGAGASLLLLIFYLRAHRRRSLDLARMRERLFRMANYDELTGLPNRNLFSDRLEHTLALARRRGALFAVMFLDLDGFKGVNDRFGHDAGDEVLRLVGRRLRGLVRDADTVARLSGDEFVVLLPDVGDREDALSAARKIEDNLSQVLGRTDAQFQIAVSVGVALYPEDGADASALLRRADQAMYKEKHPDWYSGSAG